MNYARTDLEQSLKRRVPPWKVARWILQLGAVAGSPVARPLEKLVGEGQGWERWEQRYGEMHDDFDRVDPADTQLSGFVRAFPTVAARYITGNEPLLSSDPLLLRGLVMLAMDSMGASNLKPGEALARMRQGWWTEDRRNARRKFRLLRNLSNKIDRLERGIALRNAQMQAKSRLAYAIDPHRLSDLTLAYCAYVAARANQRSMFMIGPQTKMRDTIVVELEKLLKDNPETAWDQVALIRPVPHVLELLDPEHLGELIGRFHSEMKVAARHLERLHGELPERMRDEMVMVQGVDSSSWNAFAGALNSMRSAWISALTAGGLADIVLDSYCPGKAPRLMASDLVWWYRNEGRELHEDTRLFAELAAPWDVISGRHTQTRKQVLDAARKLGIDDNGWVAPRRAEQAEEPEVQPALVHGIAVSDPGLARQLRRCGVFSGKHLRHAEELQGVEIQRYDTPLRELHERDRIVASAGVYEKLEDEPWVQDRERGGRG